MIKAILCAMLLFSMPAHASQVLSPFGKDMIAPDFQLQDTEGQWHSLSDYRGKTVVVNFWTTWCPPCREEFPSMNRLWNKMQDEGVVVLAINIGEDDHDIFIFTANYPADFPILFDRKGEVIDQWPVRGLPTTFVIAPDGRFAYRAIGARQWDAPDFVSKIRALRRKIN